jgi:hypothetical protein
LNFECALNIILTITALFGYYIIFILLVSNAISNNIAADIFCALNVAISIIILCAILFYSISYAGNPPTNEKYQKIISNTRRILIILTLTRIVMVEVRIRLME